MNVGVNPAKEFVGAPAQGWQTVHVSTGEHAACHPLTWECAVDQAIAVFTDLVHVIARLSRATQHLVERPLRAG